MDRRRVDRALIALAVGISLALTALTVWSVAQQGRALHEREREHLYDSAAVAATERRNRLREDLERLFEAAARVWDRDGAAGVQAWAARVELWRIVHIDARDASWTKYPLALFDWLLPSTAAGATTDAALHFATQLDGDHLAVIASRSIAPGARLAFAAPAAALLERYLQPPQGAPWRALLDREPRPPHVLAELGPEFGHALLTPTPEALQRLARQARLRWLVVGATALGAAGAWAVVLWLMARVLARHRELVRIQRRFVADVSHELKTPLALIRLLAETLQEGRVQDPDRARGYLQTITRESERLTVLLDSILDFSRIEAGRRPIEFVPCDLAQVARQAWSLFEPQFAAEHFDARLDIAADLPTVKADPQAIQQVIVNLLQNAYRYGAEGRFVRLAVRREGYLAVLEVEDHGIGMSRQQLARLGDSFYRAEDTRVRKTRGAGLGLAIVNHIVSAHGGKLEVHSRPGQGSRFTVWFPIDGPGGGESAARESRRR